MWLPFAVKDKAGAGDRSLGAKLGHWFWTRWLKVPEQTSKGTDGDTSLEFKGQIYVEADMWV